MMDENTNKHIIYDYADCPYDNIEKENNRRIRPIKTKQKSNGNIKKGWTQWRLNRAKEKLLGINYNSSEKLKDIQKDLLKKSKAIARLEAKIALKETGKKISEKEQKARAIKLKNSMYDALIFNCNGYSLNPEVDPESIFAPETPKKEEKKETPKEKQIDKKEIEDAIASAFSQIKKQSDDSLNKEGIGQAISEEFTEMEKKPEEDSKSFSEIFASAFDQSEKEKSTPVNVSETVKDNKDTAMKKMPEEDHSDKKGINDDIFGSTDTTYRLKGEEIDEDFRITRIPKNGRKARIEEFKYKPMTDEEIKKSQEKIGEYIMPPKQNKNENENENGSEEEKEAVIVPNERKEKSTTNLSNATAKIEEIVDKADSIEKCQEMIRILEDAKKAKEESDKRREEAEFAVKETKAKLKETQERGNLQIEALEEDRRRNDEAIKELNAKKQELDATIQLWQQAMLPEAKNVRLVEETKGKGK